jgi:synaptobrevin family protein YKT6
MKLYALYVMKRNGDQVTTLDSAKNFSDVSIVYRRSATELCDLAATGLVTSPKPDRFMSAQEKQFIFLIFRKDGAATVLVASEDYHSRVGFTILREIMGEYDQCSGRFPAGKSAVIQRAITEYQNPRNADKLLQIQSNLEEIRNIMTQNLEAALARGESLAELAEKSENISQQSKLFAREAAKLNKCCSII